MKKLQLYLLRSCFCLSINPNLNRAMKKFNMLLFSAFLIFALITKSGALASDHQYKLVIQMSSYDEKAQKRTLMRINQLLNAMKNENVVVEVVAIGPAFNLVAKNKEEKLLSLDNRKGGKFVKEVKDLIKKGVTFTADSTIQKMMRKHDMSDELIEGVKVVENGAAHILRLQIEGYKYQVMFF